MSRIEKSFVVLGGVLTRHLSQVTMDLLQSKGVFTDYSLRCSLYSLERTLFTGSISPEQYCENVLQITGLSHTIQWLESEIQRDYQITDGVLKVIKKLMGVTEVYLLSEYPRSWTDQLLKHLNLTDTFSSKSIVYVPDLGLTDYFGTLISYLVHSQALIPGSTLLIDDHPFRTSAAIRQDVDSIIFVDAGRLHRELVMRQILFS